MYTQIEITTVCNSHCFYCPQETMTHTHMSWQCFEEILQIEKEPTMLLLQGIGEPLLHPSFWKMVAYAKEKKHRVNIITNGTQEIDPQYIFLLDNIGFSLDTLCEETAQKSGRTSPSLTLKNLLACYALAPKKIQIYAVDYGQDLAPLKKFAKEHHIYITIQCLQSKKSYQVHYEREPLPYATYQCSYLAHEKMRYYFVDGTKAPCAFMVDASRVLPNKNIQEQFEQKIVPGCCTQCGELTGTKHYKILL